MLWYVLHQNKFKKTKQQAARSVSLTPLCCWHSVGICLSRLLACHRTQRFSTIQRKSTSAEHTNGKRTLCCNRMDNFAKKRQNKRWLFSATVSSDVNWMVLRTIKILKQRNEQNTVTCVTHTHTHKNSNMNNYHKTSNFDVRLQRKRKVYLTRRPSPERALHCPCLSSMVPDPVTQPQSGS